MGNTRDPTVCILYAPPADGEDASATFAARASGLLEDAGIRVSGVGPLTVPRDGGVGRPLPWTDVEGERVSVGGGGASSRLVVFLISCSADGSVERSVRKVMRKLPKSGEATTRGSSSACADVSLAGAAVDDEYAVALLGHARCENSANQMADTIFGTGRRFEKALGTSGLFAGSPFVSRLEAQVELCGPEKEFDPWVMGLTGSMRN